MSIWQKLHCFQLFKVMVRNSRCLMGHLQNYVPNHLRGMPRPGVHARSCSSPPGGRRLPRAVCCVSARGDFRTPGFMSHVGPQGVKQNARPIPLRFSRSLIFTSFTRECFRLPRHSHLICHHVPWPGNTACSCFFAGNALEQGAGSLPLPLRPSPFLASPPWFPPRPRRPHPPPRYPSRPHVPPSPFQASCLPALRPLPRRPGTAEGGPAPHVAVM